MRTEFSNINQNTARNFNKQSLIDGNKRLDLYISYETVVAFSLHTNHRNEFQICVNNWGPTTGKHLNWINENKSIRISKQEFDKKLKNAENAFYGISGMDSDLFEDFQASEEYKLALFLYLKKNDKICS